MPHKTMRQHAREQGFFRQEGNLYYRDIIVKQDKKKGGGRDENTLRRVWMGTSKYQPHQGEREMERRRRRAGGILKEGWQAE